MEKISFKICTMFPIAVFTISMLILSPYNSISQEEEEDNIDPLTMISNIKKLLDQASTEYLAGNFTGASDLTKTAYDENYELLEDPLAKLDNDLMEATEGMIKESFIGALEDKKSQAEIDSILTNIKTNLNKAEQLFNNTN